MPHVHSTLPRGSGERENAIFQAIGDTGVLLGHVVQGNQRQRDEHQAEPERAHELRAEQMAGVAGVFGQPGNQNIPPATMAEPATISGRGPIRATSCEASAEAITTPTANGR